MITKFLEIRDDATCIGVMAHQMVSFSLIEGAYLCKYSYPKSPPYSVLLTKVTDGSGCVDPYDWGDSYTMVSAHNFIRDEFDNLTDGQVVDVRVFARKTEKEPAAPEIYIP